MPFNSGESAVARDMFINERLIKMERVTLSEKVKSNAAIAIVFNPY
jgi:hypothetical protein